VPAAAPSIAFAGDALTLSGHYFHGAESSLTYQLHPYFAAIPFAFIPFAY